MSYYDRSRQDSAPRPRRQKAARNWAAGKALSHDQKAKLSILARECWSIQVEAGLYDGTANDYRREQVEIATGKAGLTACSNADYLSILGHFLKLLGRTKESAEAYSRTGRVKGSDELHDTHENRELGFHQIFQVIRISEGEITDAYADKLSRDMFTGSPIHELKASQLQSLLFTLIQRLRAKRPDLKL